MLCVDDFGRYISRFRIYFHVSMVLCSLMKRPQNTLNIFKSPILTSRCICSIRKEEIEMHPVAFNGFFEMTSGTGAEFSKISALEVSHMYETCQTALNRRGKNVSQIRKLHDNF